MENDWISLSLNDNGYTLYKNNKIVLSEEMYKSALEREKVLEEALERAIKYLRCQGTIKCKEGCGLAICRDFQVCRVLTEAISRVKAMREGKHG